MLQSRLLPDGVCKQNAKLTVAAYRRLSENRISNYTLLRGLPHRPKLVWGENKEMSTGSNFNTSTIVNPDTIKIRWKQCKFSNR